MLRGKDNNDGFATILTLSRPADYTNAIFCQAANEVAATTQLPTPTAIYFDTACHGQWLPLYYNAAHKLIIFNGCFPAFELSGCE
jgi:hypothetical protein